MRVAPLHVDRILALAAAAILAASCEEEAPPAPAEPRLQADIDADVDGDGDIDADDDEGEAEPGDARGAVLIANIDDDDEDLVRDARDARLDDDAARDLEDLTPAVVRAVRGLAGHAVRLSLGPEPAQSRVRVWRQVDGEYTVLFEPTPEEGEPVAQVMLDGADADITLLVEALVPRTPLWDGRATLTLEVLEVPGGDDPLSGEVISADVLTLRAAPLIFPDNLQPPRRIFAMNVPQGPDRNGAFLTAMRDALPAGTSLYLLDARTYDWDRWLQDTMELGYQMRPGPNGPLEMRTAMQHTRGNGGLEPFVPEEYLGPDQGYVFLGGEDTSHNYGGNLEVAPPLPGFPWGRLLYGGGSGGTLLGRPHSDTMNDEQLAFLDAQEVQGPALQLSSEWLYVGHIDEIFQFVPDLTPDEGGKAFKVVLASPALARDVLLAVQSRGGDALAVFTGRSRSFTVAQLLGAEQFLAFNEAAQARIDSVKEVLIEELGLAEDDFREVPVLFEDAEAGFAVAFNPGIQNLVTVGGRLFVPDPEGPREGGTDAWQEATRAALADTDLDVIFVDVFRSYHELFGEAHCGTNVDRAPYAPWWQG